MEPHSFKISYDMRTEELSTAHAAAVDELKRLRAGAITAAKEHTELSEVRRDYAALKMDYQTIYFSLKRAKDAIGTLPQHQPPSQHPEHDGWTTDDD